MAVWAGAETAVSLHIARGDDPNARDDAGLTPLMIAAARNKSAVCRLLIEAGADLAALDPAGRSALEIATSTGATDAAVTIERALAVQMYSEHGAVPSDGPSTCATENEANLVVEELPLNQEARTLDSIATLQPQSARLDFEDDGEPLDLAGWDAEEESVPSVDDMPTAIAHLATQSAIAQHAALDDSADWAYFEAELPAHAAPLLVVQDSEWRSSIRALLLRASREGSVPEQAVEDACRDASGARDFETESLLKVVLNDMGAETDERFEFRSPFENFDVYGDPNESDAEAENVDEAVGFFDNLRSRHNEPIRLYMREAQRTVLLSAEEEAELGESMERAAELAMDTLSCWCAGVQWVVDAIGSARRGVRSVGSISSIAHDAPTLGDGVIEESKFSEAELSPPIDEIGGDNGLRQGALEAEAPDVFALADKLAALTKNVTPGRENEIRATLATLAPRRSFLIELWGAAADGTAESNRCGQAIRALMHSRDRMVCANLRLVISLARKQMYSGVPMDDLIQDGNIGLMIAADKFDWKRGFRFSTMATWWIRQQITRSIADSSLAIRLPVHVFEIAQRFPRELDALEKTLGREPTIGQLAECIGQDQRKVERLLRACSAPLAIDALDEESNFELTECSEPFQRVSTEHLRRTMDVLLGELDARQQKIVRLRYGIGTYEPQTLEEVGALFEVTRERIRQIESKALTKLKHPGRLARLSCWSLNPDESMSAASATRAGDGGCTAASELPEPQATSRHPQAFGKTARADGGKLISPLEKVLRTATLLGVPVEQCAQGNETTTWVLLAKAEDNQHRKLIRSLLAMGFENSPGKGYWR